MLLKYRPEIDGLRAIAVFTVILYHAEFIFWGHNLFKGGFVGVDIFFVISGYLITSIILRELSEGKFSFTRFYERRARRILPALFTVMLVSIPFSYYTMLPKAVKEYAGSILSALSFVSNIWFWREDSYWATPSTLKPFLHTWSLSVEEQFYVFFPIILLLVYKFAHRYMMAIFIVVFLCSLELSHFGSAHFPKATFFLLPTRAWELLAGAILAKLEIEKGRISLRLLEICMPTIGLLMICSAIVLFRSEMRHPSFVTLLPVLGTMLLIWFCKKGELVSDILASKPFVAVGLISYSLYLWHYPIFAFARIKYETITQYDKIGLIILSIGLSLLTYFLIERPFRRSVRISLRFLTFSLTSGAILIALPLGYGLKNDGLWRRFEDWQLKYIDVDRTGEGPFATYVTNKFNSLQGKPFSNDDNQKRLLIIGDSYAQDFCNILNEGGLLEGIDVSTHYVPENCDIRQHIASQDIALCQNFIRIGNEKLDKRLAQADFIIVASSWDKFTTSQLKNLHTELKKRTHAKLFIVGKKSFYTLRIVDIIAATDKNTLVSMKKGSPHEYDNVKHAREVMRQNNNYLDLHRIVCGDTEKCPVTNPDGYLISYDGCHLSKEGATYIGKLLIKNQHFIENWTSVFKSAILK
jgi:peptidoglycan/LPS O-acetylase OafA/YrhL